MPYRVGDLITITGTLTTAEGDELDPSAVVVTITDPSGVADALTYGVDAEVVKDEVGIYHVDVDADEAGTWNYKFQSTGTGQGVDIGTFRVYGA